MQIDRDVLDIRTLTADFQLRPRSMWPPVVCAEAEAIRASALAGAQEEARFVHNQGFFLVGVERDGELVDVKIATDRGRQMLKGGRTLDGAQYEAYLASLPLEHWRQA